jgi:flagellar FliL protein
MAEKAAADAGQPQVAGRSRKKLLLLILLLLAIAAGGAGVAFVYYSPDKAAGKKAKVVKHDDDKPPVFVKLETFTVNLHDQDADRFLQVDMDLKVQESKDDELLKQRMPELRNAILLLLSSKQSSDLNTVAGKKKLSDEIKASANGLLTQVAPGAVRDVYFNSFIIQ